MLTAAISLSNCIITSANLRAIQPLNHHRLPTSSLKIEYHICKVKLLKPEIYILQKSKERKLRNVFANKNYK